VARLNCSVSRSRPCCSHCRRRIKHDDLGKLPSADHTSAPAGQARHAVRASSLGHQQSQSRAAQPPRALDPQAGDNGFGSERYLGDWKPRNMVKICAVL